jgi:hypothetical protein
MAKPHLGSGARGSRPGRQHREALAEPSLRRSIPARSRSPRREEAIELSLEVTLFPDGVVRLAGYDVAQLLEALGT